MTQMSRLRTFVRSNLLRDLVDLVGIEPTTSSMPWKYQGSRPLILKQLMAGWTGKTGINSAICYQIATKLNEWERRADSWGISPSHWMIVTVRVALGVLSRNSLRSRQHRLYRNLRTRVTFFGLEAEDLFAILAVAVVMNICGRFLNREMFGLPMNMVLQYLVPILSVPALMLFKYGKQRGYLLDWVLFHTKPHVYSALEQDRELTREYIND